MIILSFHKSSTYSQLFFLTALNLILSTFWFFLCFLGGFGGFMGATMVWLCHLDLLMDFIVKKQLPHQASRGFIVESLSIILNLNDNKDLSLCHE